MKNLSLPSLKRVLLCSVSAYFCCATDLSATDVPNLNVETSIIGGTTETGVYILDNTGSLFLSDTPLLPGNVPASLSHTLFWDSEQQSFFAGRWKSIGSWAAMGFGSAGFGAAWAHGNFSLAQGEGSYAEGHCSAAFGTWTISQGNFSLAAGHISFAHGEASVALGRENYAGGWSSAAIGFGAISLGVGAVALGDGTAAGDYSTALGVSTLANAYGSVAIGQYNKGFGSPTTWTPADPVFEIGIGTSTTATANALTVYKDGKVIIEKAQGDISMGEFGN